MLEKILEEMKKIKDGNRKENLYAKYPPKDEQGKILNGYSQGYEDGTDNFYNAMVDIIRNHMNDDKCGECSRRRWYQKGYVDGKKEKEEEESVVSEKFLRECKETAKRYKRDNDGWIPCDERLPDTEHSVLMCDANGCRDVGWWTGKRWVTGFSHADIARDIIAWRPLPEPYRPEKGEEE